MSKIKLKKFPHPYNAGLAICSDIDGTSWDNFLKIHTFLNSEKESDFGRGLSLPISSSFWMYDQPNLRDAAFSYFKDKNGIESKIAPVMRELIRAGILDVMHGYGNFADVNDFSRALADQALNELEKHRLKIKVWTNHGGVESAQNIGQYSAGKGDIKIKKSELTKEKTDFYHLDLLMKHGIQFFWDSEASLTSIVGQDRKFHFGEAYWNSPLFTGFKPKIKITAKGILSFVDKNYFNFFKHHFTPWQPYNSNNELMKTETLRDGNNLKKFIRFGNGRFDWQEHLTLLLNNRVLERLLEKKGYLVVYIHLGDKLNKADPGALSLPVIDKFHQLKDLYLSGDLWIETTSRLLTYNYVYNSLNWNFSETETHYQINIKDEIKHESKLELAVSDLAGLSFIAPGDKEVLIFFKDKPLKFKIYQNPGENKQTAMIPLKSTEWLL
ncbi:hypothetical protein B6I21_06085 [candidate division KSB1 bacterium 4572_119]|nr:MAG: hypothetical protein B6I21_06085 [candidate division KSB1 bacterium 4572_119]